VTSRTAHNKVCGFFLSDRVATSAKREITFELLSDATERNAICLDSRDLSCLSTKPVELAAVSLALTLKHGGSSFSKLPRVQFFQNKKENVK